jgi:hypothetical protein
MCKQPQDPPEVPQLQFAHTKRHMKCYTGIAREFVDEGDRIGVLCNINEQVTATSDMSH